MTAPAGGFAFFDVDETLIAMKSMFDFFPYWCARQGQPGDAQLFEQTFASARAQGQAREQLNRLYYGFLAGAPLQDVTLAGQEWFERRFGGERPPYLAPVVARLKAHRAAGIEPVFVSGSMLPLLSPLAAELGVSHCLCTTLMVDEQGRLTGAIGQPQTIGSGKADALRQFLRQRGVPAQDCYAYGDDLSDLPMLEAVGRPVAVGANRGLAELAGQRGWGQLAL